MKIANQVSNQRFVMQEAALPLVLSHVKWESTPQILRFDTGCMTLEIGKAHAEYTRRFLTAADGTQSVRSIAKKLSSSSDQAAELAGTLYRFGVLADTAALPVEATAFCEHIVTIGRGLRAQMSERADLLDRRAGGPSRRLLLGSLVETYHFVRSASFHISEAIVHTSNSIARSALSHLLAEEMDHFELLARGLRHADILEPMLATSCPLPETLAVINFLRVLSSSDLLAYMACVGVNESPRGDKQIKKDWDALASLDLLPPETLAPFRGHESEDQALDHASVPQVVFQQEGTISAPQQQRIRMSLLAFLETQASCYRGIKRFYRDAGGPPVFSLQ
jgi:hypothetical protein